MDSDTEYLDAITDAFLFGSGFLHITLENGKPVFERVEMYRVMLKPKAKAESITEDAKDIT
jgi:hypothetical protein